MPLGFNKLRQDQRYLAPADDEPIDYGPGLELVRDLLKDGKRAGELTKQALEATGAVKAARAAMDTLLTAQKKAEAGIAAAHAEIDRLNVAHKAEMAKREAEIAAPDDQIIDTPQLSQISRPHHQKNKRLISLIFLSFPPHLFTRCGDRSMRITADWKRTTVPVDRDATAQIQESRPFHRAPYCALY
jgi:hypothetical protein